MARKPRKIAFNTSNSERWFVWATYRVSSFGSGVGFLLWVFGCCVFLVGLFKNKLKKCLCAIAVAINGFVLG